LGSITLNPPPVGCDQGKAGLPVGVIAVEMWLPSITAILIF
jgi:hypothetical protein